jgi:membrane protease YdiL (CAAX protease family)
VPRENRVLLAFAGAYIFCGYAKRFVSVPMDDPVLFWSGELGVYFAFAAVLAALAFSQKLAPREYGLVRPLSLRTLASDTAICYVVFAVIVFLFRYPLSAFLQLFANEPPVGMRAFQVVKGNWNTELMAIVLCISSVLEEIVYRGMLRRLISNTTAYFLVSTILFAGIHSNQGMLGITVAAFLGLVACGLYVRIGTLWPLILAHIGVNLSVLVWHVS